MPIRERIAVLLSNLLAEGSSRSRLPSWVVFLAYWTIRDTQDPQNWVSPLPELPHRPAGPCSLGAALESPIPDDPTAPGLRPHSETATWTRPGRVIGTRVRNTHTLTQQWPRCIFSVFFEPDQSLPVMGLLERLSSPRTHHWASLVPRCAALGGTHAGVIWGDESTCCVLGPGLCTLSLGIFHVCMCVCVGGGTMLSAVPIPYVRKAKLTEAV